MRIWPLYAVLPFLSAVALIVAPSRTVGLGALVVATIVWWVFVAWYTVRSRWWRTKYGRSVAGLGTGIAVLLTVFIAAILFGKYPGYELVWTLVFLNVAVLGIQHTYYMEKVQQTVKREESL